MATEVRPNREVYPFSPILDKRTYVRAIAYIAYRSDALSERIFDGEWLPQRTLRMYAHYPDEHQFLREHLASLGTPVPDERVGGSFSVRVNTMIQGHAIRQIGVLEPSPDRMQSGSVDWEVPDFATFRQRHLDPVNYVVDVDEYSDVLRVWHPDEPNVVGYVVPEALDSHRSLGRRVLDGLLGDE